MFFSDTKNTRKYITILAKMNHQSNLFSRSLRTERMFPEMSSAYHRTVFRITEACFRLSSLKSTN